MAEPPAAPEMEGPVDDRFPDDKIVVGVDFGTKNSGVAFQLIRRNQRMREVVFEIPTVRGWPTSHGADRDESKVPSTLRYDANKEVTSWGYQFDDEVDGDQSVGTLMEWFKLAIIPDKDLPPYLRRSPKLKQTKDTLRDLSLTVTEVIEQYLQRIWKHALRKIAESSLVRDLESTPIHVVLTVPAIWGHHAIETMRVAADRAYWHHGPEAAAQAYEKVLQSKLRVDEVAILVDLGGGTADVIPYIKKSQGEVLQLEEAAPGDGALCGAMFLDEAFEALLLSELSAEDKKIKTDDPVAWRTLLSEQWQHSIKRSFEWEGKREGRTWPVTLSNVPRRKVDLDEDQIRDVFEGSVMPGILRLIKCQTQAIKKAHDGRVPRIILPVGGFGRCPYIIQRLRQEFDGANVSSKGSGNKRKKGDDMADCGQTQPMYLSCDVDAKGPRTERSSFFTFDDTHPPEHYDQGDPKFVEYGEIEITATKLIEDLPVVVDGDEIRREFRYNLQVKFVGGSVAITATSAHAEDHGKQVGRAVLSGLEAK
ncbi:hypothetical protein Daus18300_008118 [Diaporthe australafricana]|uniref:Hsp70 family chaperone n=1 Tax=Diaporthe australafricana TaxID=127596 RepID=A0ABR3WJG1_9PEZI